VAASALKCKPELDNNVKIKFLFAFRNVNNSIESLLSLYHAFILLIFSHWNSVFSYFKNNGFIFRNRNISGAKALKKWDNSDSEKHKAE
jgi:hypothetical protein